MNKLDKTCPMCEEGTLAPTTRVVTFEHHGSDLAVEDLEVSTCSACDSELVLPEQSKRNQVKITDEKRKRDGLLTSQEIISFRKRHKLTQAKASKIFGVGINAFSKYERGINIQSLPMDKILRVAIDDTDTLHRLMKLAGIMPVEDISKNIICSYSEPCMFSMEESAAPLQGAVINRTKVIGYDGSWERMEDIAA